MKRFFWLFLAITGGIIYIARGKRLFFPGENSSSAGKSVAFYCEAESAIKVSLAGDFNDWDPNADPMLNLGDGTFGIALFLKPGRYEYKYIVDGANWIHDPCAQEMVDDSWGGKRSVVIV